MVGLPIPKVGFAPTEIAAGRRVPVPPKTTQPAYTPCAGTTRCGGQARFAVGTPSALPRPSPCTTTPSSHGSRPSRRAAWATSPWAISSRIQEDETRSPSIVTSGTLETVNACSRPSSISRRVSPTALWPKR